MRAFKLLLVVGIVVGASIGFAPKAALADRDADASRSPQSVYGKCTDRYAIMCRGAEDAEAVLNYINHSDERLNYQAIYAKYGLTKADYRQFAIGNKQGTISRDGTITVDGKAVARSTMSLARSQGNGYSKKVVINGKTYWGGSYDKVAAGNQTKVIVYMKDGKLKFAMLASNGNPQQLATLPPKPEEPPRPQDPKPEPAFSCDMIQKQRTGKDRYAFTTKARAEGGAQILKVVYDFGDGNTATRFKLDSAAEHTFTKSSRVRATVHIQVRDDARRAITSSACATDITVATKPPVVSNAYCRAFEAPVLVNEDTRQYSFTVVANTTNARFVKADFRFADSGQVLPAQPNGDKATIRYAFTKTGTHQVTATLHFVGADGKSFSGDCVANVTVADKPTATAPVVAATATKGQDASCDEADGKNCELTKTGPGTIIASIFGGATAMATAGHFVIRRRLGL